MFSLGYLGDKPRTEKEERRKELEQQKKKEKLKKKKTKEKLKKVQLEQQQQNGEKKKKQDKFWEDNCFRSGAGHIAALRIRIRENSRKSPGFNPRILLRSKEILKLGQRGRIFSSNFKFLVRLLLYRNFSVLILTFTVFLLVQQTIIKLSTVGVAVKKRLKMISHSYRDSIRGPQF